MNRPSSRWWLAASGFGVVCALLPGLWPLHAWSAQPAPAAAAPSSALPPLTGRRDPLDLPLREEDRWREWLLAVRLNGREISTGTVVLRDPQSGRLAAPVEELRRWRVKISRDWILTFQGMPFVPLDALPGARVSFDESALELALDLPPTAFEPSVIVPDRPERPPPTTGAGAFLDYDLILEAGRRSHERASGLAEAGLFGDYGNVLASLRVEDALGEPEFDRLETTFARDFPELRTTLRLGDSLTAGGSFARSVRFAGIQYGTNFATDPGFVTFPLPAIGGLAEQPSTVEVLVDNVRQLTSEVQPGPFTIANVPVVTGAGEVQLKITDLLGRERLVAQSYYVSPRLLRAGLHDFSYEAGFARERFGEASFDYGSALAVATHRYGFTDSVTGEVHAETDFDGATLFAGGALRLGILGLVTAGLGGSAGEDGDGFALQASYEYVSRSIDVGLRTRYLTQSFALFGETTATERTDEMSLGFRVGESARLGLLLAHQVRRDEEDTVSASASFSSRLGPGSLIVNAAALFEPDHDLAVTVAYTLPLSNDRAATAQLEASRERMRARAQFRQGRGARDLGLDYRIAGELGDRPRYLDARLSYQGRVGTAELEADVDSEGPNVRLGVNGTAVLLDGRFGLTRRIGRAFGLVRVPGLPGVRVYLDNREVGRTDARGELVVPGLRPYEANRIRIDVEDLPLGVVPETTEIDVTPTDRGATVVAFAVETRTRAVAHFVDANGRVLPAGLEMHSTSPAAVEILVARDGFGQITGDGIAGSTIATGEMDGRRYACPIPPIAAGQLLPDLGTIACSVR